VPYASGAGVALGQLASLLGVGIVFAALRFGLSKRTRIAAGSLGAVLALAPMAVYGVTLVPALVLAGALAVFSLRNEIRRAFERRRAVEENG
jgi:hypothetical protein